MSRLLRVGLAALVGVSGCGPGAPVPAGGEHPGWYSLPDEPANGFLGEARLRLVQGGLQGELTLSAELTRPVYFAVKWQGLEPQRITEALDPSVSKAFSGAPFEAPPGVRVPETANPACSTAEGRLLAYALRSDATTPDPRLDELIGVGQKPEWLFPYSQSAYNQTLTWRSCQAGSGDLMPMQFQFDPRLRLALCDETTEPAELVCGQPALDRTRITAMEATVDEGRVFLSPNFVARVEGPVTYAVNGVSFTATAGQLRTPTADGPWRAGRNQVEVRQGTLAPWSAEVVLPADSLRPRLHEAGLREGASFTASWDAAPWASRYTLLSFPLDVPARRVADPRWDTEQASVTETFPGFKDTQGDRLEPQRAMFRLTVIGAVGSSSTFSPFHSSAAYVVEWTEDFEVAYLR